MLVAGLELMVWWCFLNRRAARTVSIPFWCRGLWVVVGLAVAGLSLWWLGPRLALDDSILNRPRIWLAGLRLFAANPGGVGLGRSGMLASSFLLDDGVTVRTLVGSHLTLLVECGWFIGWVWGMFIALALTGLRESPRIGLAFAGIALSACTSTVFDWAVLFDFAEQGGLGWTNWVLSWGMFAFFVGCGAWLVGGRSKLRPSRLENCGVSAREGRNLLRPRALAALACSGALVLAARLVPPGNAPHVTGGYAVVGDGNGPLVLRDGAWDLRAVRAFFPDGACYALDPVVWRSYPNHPHDVPPGSVRLAQAFLAHCHAENRRDLGMDGGVTGVPSPYPYVGDDLEGMFHLADSVDAQSIPPADRVPLPNRAVAEAWGCPGEGASPAVHGEARISSFTLAGVPFVLREPAAHSQTSRVAVLFGGRNWPGGRTLEAFGFDAVADRFGMFLLAPSFDDGIPFRPYWEPRSGTGRLLLRAVGEVERRFDLAPGRIVLYGYSAGGQCAALFASYLKGRVAAWGAHACGVFPEPPLVSAPALLTCGVGDVDRLRIGQTFACRYREAGGSLVWRTMEGGHELGASALGLARAFFGAVASGAPCACWGEDGTWRVLERERIAPEYRSPLYTPALAELWRRAR